MREPYRIYNDIEACIKEVNQFQLKDIIINEAFYSGHSIDFLLKMPTVEKVHILSDQIDDFSTLYEMPCLKKLVMDISLKKPLDLSRFDLEELSINWSKKIIGLGTLVNVRKLSLSGYRSSSRNLMEFKNMRNLEELELVKGNIGSLKGLKKINKLKKLTLVNLNSLHSLSSSESKSDSITDIEIKGCHKINDIEYVACFKNVSRLVLDRIGKVPSLKFVAHMEHLSYFVILATEIEDGDLTPCLGIDYVQFDERSWYSHSNAEFKKANGLAKKNKKLSR
jgi:protein phosphatase 1 regulatory subunit 7